MDPLNVLWFYFVLASLQPVIQRQLLLVRRRAALSSILTCARATVITLIHRQETMSLFGFPLVRYIGLSSRPAAPHANRLATP